MHHNCYYAWVLSCNGIFLMESFRNDKVIDLHALLNQIHLFYITNGIHRRKKDLFIVYKRLYLKRLEYLILYFKDNIFTTVHAANNSHGSK